MNLNCFLGPNVHYFSKARKLNIFHFLVKIAWTPKKCFFHSWKYSKVLTVTLHYRWSARWLNPFFSPTFVPFFRFLTSDCTQYTRIGFLIFPHEKTPDNRERAINVSFCTFSSTAYTSVQLWRWWNSLTKRYVSSRNSPIFLKKDIQSFRILHFSLEECIANEINANIKSYMCSWYWSKV
jgi:hypothetical protein